MSANMVFEFSLPDAGSSLKKALYLYPDVLDYKLNQQDYNALWQRLNPNNGGYLAVYAGQLTCVGWLRSIYESVMGWFGFTNACDPARVKMAAQKLAYYGYLNGFNQTDLKLGSDWGIKYQSETEFMNLCRQVRSNVVSSTLQQKLVSFYQVHAPRLGALTSDYFYQVDKRYNHAVYLAHKKEFIFGSTYGYFNNLQQMAYLDVQNESLIKYFLRPGSVDKTHERSTFRRLSANCNLNSCQDDFNRFIASNKPKGFMKNFYAITPFAQSKGPSIASVSIKTIYQSVKKELKLWPELRKENLKFLIELNMAFANSLDISDLKLHLIYDEVYELALEQPDLLTADLLRALIHRCLNIKHNELATILINKLYITDSDEALKFACSRELYPFLTSPLKERVASQLIQDAKSRTFFSGFFGSQKDQLYTDAARLNPAITNQEGASYFFSLHIKNMKWLEAWALFEEIRYSATVTQLQSTDLVKLAEYYSKRCNRLYNEGRALRVSNIIQAEEKYRESLSMMERAAMLDASEQNLVELNVHRRLLAQIIIDGEEKKSSISYKRVVEARRYLEEIKNSTHSTSDPYLKPCFIKIINHQVKILHQACLGAERNEDVIATDAHKKKCEPFLNNLMKFIDELIELRTELLGHSSEEMDEHHNRSSLAADYCLKAECINYFELQGNALDDYKKACELEPNHPFYYLLYNSAEFLQNERPLDSDLIVEQMQKGSDLLKQSNVTYTDWSNWYKERWMKESQRVFKINMPEPVLSLSASSGSTLKSILGFTG